MEIRDVLTNRVRRSFLVCLVLPMFACDTQYDVADVQKWTEIRGTVRVKASLNPDLLPDDYVLVEGFDAGNCVDSFNQLPVAKVDEPPLEIRGEIGSFSG